ncbi:spermidine synthase [Actinotalea solisilvae]|uniref:spermidine synthase n=1 Tax=Actinotalea solisilvae TaxID=2072922 RepID=UPI0018F1C8F6|nr:fused MFS/spermidine synthase [Actinotalea solisilvae]
MPDRPAARGRHGRGGRAAGAAQAAPDLPEGPVRIATGTAEVRRSPDDPRSVTLYVNGVPSSHLDLDDPTWLEFEYMQHMAAIIAQTTDTTLDAVHLGAAGCALPRWLDAVRPGSHQVAVDVDAVLLEHVRRWFALPRSPRLRLRPGEAREVLAALPAASADVVVRDVFAPDTTPAHLTTSEFLAEVVRVLRPGGLYLANVADRPPLAVARAEVATVRAALDDALLVAEPGQLRGRRYGNLVVGGRAPGGPAAAEGRRGLARRLRSLPVPAALLEDDELAAFAGTVPPLRDVAPEVAGPDDDGDPDAA